MEGNCYLFLNNSLEKEDTFATGDNYNNMGHLYVGSIAFILLMKGARAKQWQVLWQGSNTLMKMTVLLKNMLTETFCLNLLKLAP